MSLLVRSLKQSASAVIRLLLRGYFRRIEILHPERVPAGPVLLVANHPGSVTDGFITGTLLPRRAHFMATAQLFRFAPLGWLLRQCDVIPLNRREDDPKAMHTVADSFAAAFTVLAAGGMVVIFPEGVTYDDSRLRMLKTGAARIALELEARHGGQLGLQIVPLGLTYTAKERFRSDVLVYFGEPIRVANFLPQYAERRKECIHGLTQRIARRMQSLLVHLPAMEREHLVAAIKRLYLGRLRLGNQLIREPVGAIAEETLLTQAMVDALEFAFREMPGHMERFQERLHRYERLLSQLRLSDAAVEELAAHRYARIQVYGWGLAALLLFPFAALGWLHWRPVTALVNALAGRFLAPGKRKAQTPHARMLLGLVLYGAGLAGYGYLAGRWFGPRVALAYAASLPLLGYVEHYYLGEASRLFRAARTAAVLLRAPLAKRRVLWMRAELIREIETVRRAYGQTLAADGRPAGRGQD
jgi:glycerol-3-phosphate O-acyltransferase / dihydroxyacetone phosphate acyltransferase